MNRAPLLLSRIVVEAVTHHSLHATAFSCLSTHVSIILADLLAATSSSSQTQLQTKDLSCYAIYSGCCIEELNEFKAQLGHHLPGPPPRPPLPATPNATTTAVTQALNPKLTLYKAFHHILTNPTRKPTTLSPTRHHIAMGLLQHTTLVPRWELPDTMYTASVPVPPCTWPIVPTFAVPASLPTAMEIAPPTHHFPPPTAPPLPCPKSPCSWARKGAASRARTPCPPACGLLIFSEGSGPSLNLSIILADVEFVGNGIIMRCEVSERATHRLSPHGPCEPSARLPSETNVLPTICIVFPAIRPLLLYHRHLDTTIPHDQGLSTPSPQTRHLQQPGASHTTQTVFVVTRHPPTGYDHSPVIHVSIRRRSLAPGRTYRVPDTDPSDEAEDIPTQPVPHFTQRIN
ncbi:hypothetical protein B0H14DRAFT_3480298 [Mycena olivaceomarginata]|nr:hypothetical protein B0H14DRAFT_3480298 [Mycena olivaceomarginata]